MNWNRTTPLQYAEGKAVCVSIHDVAPATWADCRRLMHAIAEVADLPLTFLVVPQFHGDSSFPAEYGHALDRLQQQGHELALHGYTHFDSAAPSSRLQHRFLRTVYTQQEGEFAALEYAQARRLLDLGLEWFARRGWPVKGFIAPAWLLSEGSWQALRAYPFEYTTTYRQFHLLPHGPALDSPSLVYTARNALGRQVSRLGCELLQAGLRNAPLARLSLHPRDARYPELLRHLQRLLEKLLVSRVAMTKAQFAGRWRQGMAATG